MKKIYLTLSSILVLLFVGCASKTVDIKPQKITKEKSDLYSKYSCNQINTALGILEKRAQRIARVQNDNAASDRVLLSWGWILYGVPYLFLDGNGEAKKEFEVILGEKEALENLAVEKDCNFDRKTIHHTYEGDY